jgi:DNA-binding MarR family transcriptional regulator
MDADATLKEGISDCLLAVPEDEAVAAFKQLWVTFLKLQRQLEEVLEPHGLVLSQFEALVKIGVNPGMIQQELVKHLLVTKGNVGALLDRLEALEWVQRCSCPNDRRANKLYLTSRGIAMIQEIIKKHRVFIAESFRGLSVDQRVQLRGLLKTIEPGQ